MKRILFAAALIAPIAASAADGRRLDAIAHFNPYPEAGYNDCWGYTAPDGREYALLGVQNGTSVVDITDAPELREIAFIPSEGSLWKDIKTLGHYAYVVNESGGGLQVIDLSELPARARLAATYQRFQTSHNISIDVARAMLYAEGDEGEPVRALSLARPLEPRQVSAFGVEAHDILARDGVAYVSEGYHGTIGVYDLRTPSTPRLMGRFQIPDAGYVHNAWPTDDGTHLMTTEETGGKSLKMWDVRDLSDVRMTGEYLAPNGLAHNTHIKGDYAYISHYGSGLRIVDLTDRSSLREVAYHQKDGAPGRAARGDLGAALGLTPAMEEYTAAWGAYPFFRSGKVLVSDIEAGLFVVEFEGAREDGP